LAGQKFNCPLKPKTDRKVRKVLRLGTSGFSFKDWIGPVYPPGIKPPEMLKYYEKDLGFDTLEVNFTYYSLPSVRSFEGMARKTSKNFEFVVKANRGMTHDMINTDTWTLEDNSQVFEKFNLSLTPLKESGKLGCVLAQFPPFFYPKKETMDYMLTFKERMGEVPVVVEFRNKAWLKESVFQFLQKNDLGYCIVDEPQLPGLMPYQSRATTDIGYFRFHGRNRNWFNVPAAERYNYLYSEEELRRFVPDIKRIAKETSKAYIFFNNCHAGKAAKNAEMMKKLLGLVTEYTGKQTELGL